MKKKKKSKTKIKYRKQYKFLLNSIKKYNNIIPIHNFEDKNTLNLNSDIQNIIYNNSTIDKCKYYFKKEEVKIKKKEDKIFSCKKVILLPTEEQKTTLLKMMEGYRLMYNHTIKFFRRRRYLYNQDIKNKVVYKKIDYSNIKDKKEIRIMRVNEYKTTNKLLLDFKIIRTYFLKDIKNEIYKKYETPSHILDNAVKNACTMYKSALTNLMNKNIKHFCLRYIKQKKKSLILDVDKQYISLNTIIKSKLGDKLKNKENIQYNNKHECKIYYDSNIDRFTLLVPTSLNKEEKPDDNSFISIDPGVRTYLNCISKNNYIEIGNNISDKLKNLNKKIDNNKSNKKIKILRNKIKNIVDDFHWKTIHYLTSNYKNIIIGNMSTKSIIRNEDSVLNKMTKRIANNLSFYKFRSRLQYKCNIKENKLLIVDEKYTSKMCTKCGELHQNLGSNKIYKCKHCNLNIKRDYNGARNILLKSIDKITKKIKVVL
jgi:putative transposase